MDTIEQLKTMRDQAKARIEALPDYKLMTKLTALIEDLEEVFTGADGETAETPDDEEAGDADDDAARSFAHVEPDSESEPAEEPEPATSEAFEAGEPVETGDAPAEDEELTALADEADEIEAGEREGEALDPDATNVLAELEKLTSGIRDGEAQHDVEQTDITDPAEEVAAEIALEDAASPAEEAPVEQMPAGEIAEEDDLSMETDSAILQAMAELEADLGNADLDIEEDDEQRYGNS